MIHRSNLLWSAIAASTLLLSPALAGAQEAPPTLPLLEPVAELERGDPSPCFEFWCFDRTAFEGERVASVGAAYAAVYLSVRDASGAWVDEVTLRVPEPSELTFEPNPDTSEGGPGDWPYIYDQLFGLALALDDDELIFSHDRHLGDDVYDPRVYVFRRTRAGWTHRQTIPLAGGCESGLGHLSLESGTAVLGSCVFERDCHGDYEFVTRLAAPDGAPVLGTLSAEGRSIVGGSAAANDGAGAVWVFQRRGSRWLLLAEVTSPTGALDTGFGSAVSQSGRYLAVGAPTTPVPVELRRGAVHLYVRRGNGFELVQTLENPIPPDDDLRDFGSHLTLEGERLLVGTYSHFYGGPWDAPAQPTVYLYEREGTAFSATAVLDALWSRSVFLSDRYAVVGATSYAGGTFPLIYELPSSCH